MKKMSVTQVVPKPRLRYIVELSDDEASLLYAITTLDVTIPEALNREWPTLHTPKDPAVKKFLQELGNLLWSGGVRK